MSTYNPPSPSFYYSCPPDQFAVFKRGDKALCLVTFGRNDWDHGVVPEKGKVYTVRDYHFGHSTSPQGVICYGQILSLEGITCDFVQRVGAEFGWFHTGFRKVTEEEALAAESAREPAAMEASQ